ncbi:MAG: endoglycoceramidase [Hydrocarboniphaga sp.]|nr:endoglycoceramidase [Hydrocarboniphaga sp.]
MGAARLGLAALLVAVLGSCGASSTPTSDKAGSTKSAVATMALPLNHAGRWITDAQGRVVTLHGINMVYKRPPYAPDAIGFDDDDAAFLAGEGYNTVRLGIIYKALEPTPGVYDDAYLDRIAQTADTLARHGIVALLDFHQDLYNEKFGGEGLPDWAVQDDGLPNQPQLDFTLNYFLELGLNRAFDHFWHNDAGPDGVGLQDRYALAWRHVAEHFRGHNAVLGYDLFNEPWPGTQYPTCLSPLGCPVFDQLLADFSRRVIAQIRAADPQALVWYEPNVIFNNGARSHLGDLGDANLGFSFHDYCLTEPITGSNLACDPFDNLVFNNALSQIDASGDTWLLTEFGASDDLANLQAMLDRADSFMVGWQYWAYCGCNDPTTTGENDTQAIVYDPAQAPTGDNLKADKLALLSRPYPQRVAGTPLSYGYAMASRTFTLRYSTAAADGSGAFGDGAETVIAVPMRAYPQGYRVSVEHGSVASAADAPLLRVRSASGAGMITVTVTTH